MEKPASPWRDAKTDLPKLDQEIWGARFITSKNENGGFWDYFVCHLDSLRITSEGTSPNYEKDYETVIVDYWTPIIEPPKPAEK